MIPNRRKNRTREAKKLMANLDRKYLAYLGQHLKMDADRGESPASMLYRACEVRADLGIPCSNVYFLDEPCSFLEAVLLRRQKSLLFKNLDQINDDTMIMGLEQSQSFVGKASLFCAFKIRQLAEIDWLEPMKHTRMAICGHHDGEDDWFVVACPFSTMLLTQTT